MATPTDNNTYIIMNKLTNTVLDDTAGNPTPGTNVVGWQWHSGPDRRNQQWTIKAASQDENQNDYHFIYNLVAGNALDANGPATQDGTPLVTNGQANSVTQKWRFVLVDQGFPQSYLIHNLGDDIKNNGSGPQVVDLYGGNRANGTKVQMYHAHDVDGNKPGNKPPSDNQLWMFIPVPTSS